MSKVGMVVTLVAAVATGCGGGSSSGTGFHTSVAGNKPVDQLSSSEVQQLCMDLSNYIQAQYKALETKEYQCRGAGLAVAALSSMSGHATDAEIQASCQAGYTLCEASDAGAPDAGTQGPMCMNAMVPTMCTATVNQYSACVSEVFASVSDLFPPCNQLTAAKVAAFSDGGAGTSSTLGSGPACTAFMAACPGSNLTSSSSMP